jgi:hypothetical protein
MIHSIEDIVGHSTLSRNWVSYRDFLDLDPHAPLVCNECESVAVAGQDLAYLPGHGKALCLGCALESIYKYNGQLWKSLLYCRYDEETAEWLEEELTFMGGDNVRFARKGDTSEEALYREKKENGCCGFTDKTVTHPETGETFLIGCNYGH